ncbi:MAG: DUF1289 domain-containing protein [Alphaproteobacteria bacterium]|nr:DUF1289 domain-containing protein [Alphaproteobacteria bacterium]
MTIESPCIKTCVLDRVTGLCIGCGRSGSEIAAWSRLTSDARRAIMDGLAERLRTMTSRHVRA